MRDGLRAARHKRGFTQQQLVVAVKERAPDVHLVRATISKYEHGIYDIPGRILEVLAEVLETSMDILYANNRHLLDRKADDSSHAPTL